MLPEACMSDNYMKGNKTFFATNRIETLTDGVFAIVMTLLVLNLAIPEISQTSAQELFSRILQLWPKLLSYTVSFIILGIFWVGHHHIFHYIKRANAGLLWINIFFLLFIALIPFSTALSGDYSSIEVPFIIYGINLVPIFILRYALWEYATYKHRLVENNIDNTIVRRLKSMPLISSIMLLFAIGISLINITAGYAVLIMMLLYGALSHRIFKIN
jgi:uncharacterized membrane protein